MYAEDKALEWLESFGEKLSKQDNRATKDPMYVVFEYPKQPDAHANPSVFVDVFFTNEAAERYINRHAHNLNSPIIYVDSGWRNPEWSALRELAIQVYLQRYLSKQEE